MSEQYDAVCAERFTQIQRTQEKQSKDIQQIREKLFNGVAGAAARIPEIERMTVRLETKMDTLVKRREKSGKGVAKQRGMEVAIMALIISAVSQWDKIIEFAGRFF